MIGGSVGLPADAVISTTPTPQVSALVPDLPQEWKERYDSIHNVGVICVIFKLHRSVSPHFWVNISEPGLEIPGIIEFSNLRQTGEHSIVYIPFYMPVTQEKFSWPDDRSKRHVGVGYRSKWRGMVGRSWSKWHDRGGRGSVMRQTRREPFTAQSREIGSS